MSQRLPQFSMETLPQPAPRRPHYTVREYDTRDELYSPHHDPDEYRNGVDPIFGMTESEFLGDVGDK